jgi:hypothetical protein
MYGFEILMGFGKNRFGHESRWEQKPRIALLERVSSNLLLCYIGLSFILMMRATLSSEMSTNIYKTL